MGCHQEHSALETCPVCGFDPFVRNHYFTGKMMGATEFATETLYHAEKMRHHNLRLHGTGTVCGLRVVQHPSPDCRRRYVVVEPGSALDCCGREILVSAAETLDVARNPAVLRLAADGLLHALQVCVRYRDCPTEDVPVLYDECGCDDTQCAPNRILESFAFDVLVDPPLTPYGSTQLDAAGALVATDVHGVTGFLRASAAGKLAMVDLSDAKHLVVIDLHHRSQLQVTFNRAIRALALSADGVHVFAVTDSSDAAPEAEVRVVATADGSEVGPVNAGALRKLPGSSVTSVLRAAATTDANRVLVVHERATGTLHAFAVDASHVVKDVPAAISSMPQLDGFVASANGARAYAIDSAANKVKVIDYSGAAPPDLSGLPAGARAVALAAYLFQAQPFLAVASAVDRRLYFVDLGAGTVRTVDLLHPPESLGAVGDGSGTGVWLHVLEREPSAWYLQSVALAPSAVSGVAPLVTAPRLVGTRPKQIVLVGGGSAALLDPTTLAEGECSDHVWHQLDGCPACDSGDCVVLATIANYRAGNEMLDLPALADDLAQARSRIDNRNGRHMLASTSSLQAWLECLDTGQGKDGKDGLGLDPNLPKIIDIGWSHASQIPVLTWFQRLFAITPQGQPIPVADVIEAVRGGQRVPLFTIYFNRSMKGIDRQSLRVRVDIPGLSVDAAGVPHAQGIYSLLGHEIYGNVIDVPGPVPTPHTGESAAYAVVFVPRPEYLATAALLLAQPLQYVEKLGLEWPTFTVVLKGEFIFAPDASGNYTDKGVLDGENIGGRTGINEVRPPPIKGGKNPTGDLAQGGRFESWFFLKASGDVQNDSNVPPGASDPADPLRGRGDRPLVVNPNFVSREALLAVPGVSKQVADRLIAARDRQAFEGVRDLRERAQINERDWKTLRDHLLLI